MARRRPSSRGRDYDRTERVGELIRRILAEELERYEDERLEMVAVTEVDVDRDLNVAEVFFSALDDDHDDEILEALEEYRSRLRRAVGAQTRLRRTPELAFRPDHGIRHGERVDELLRDLDGTDERVDELSRDLDGTGGEANPG